MSLRTRIAAVIGVVTFFVLVGGGSAYGFWTAAQASISGSATAASISVSMTGDLTTTYAFSGNGATTTPTPAGAVLIREAVVTNSSTVPLAVTLTATRGAASTLGTNDIQMWMYAKAGATCAAQTGAGTVFSSSLAYAVGSVAANSAASVCIATRLNNTIPATTGKNLVVTLAASAVLTGSTWSAAASTASTQVVYSVPKPSVTCTDNTDGNAYGLDLHFTGAAGFTYDVYKSVDNGATYTLVTANVPNDSNYTATQAGGGYVIGTGVEFLRITANGAYGLSPVSTAIPIRYENVLFGFAQTIRCNPVGTY